MQQRLKSRSRAARAEVVAPELLAELDVAVHEPAAALDLGLGRERVPPLTRDRESRGGRRSRDACAWHPPIVKAASPPGARFYHAGWMRPSRGAATMWSRTAGFSAV